MIQRRLILPMAVACSGLFLLFAACQVPARELSSDEIPTQTQPDSAGEATSDIPAGCPASFAITSTLPTDTRGTNQANVNCFAWQSFIALNWPADPANNGQPNPQVLPQAFGQPTDLSPTVWESYKATQDLFLPGAQPPAPWNSPNTIPATCQAQVAAAKLPHQTFLFMTAKSSDGEVFTEVQEATGQILVDQTANLVRFEKRVNQTEFDYITTHQLYDANRQATMAISPGLVLPAGAIEIKAAWRQLAGLPANLSQRYKQTLAFLYDSATDSCTGPFSMGLIALHIIRKTASMRQFMWSTFEQVDNVAGSAAHAPNLAYALYNAKCQAPAPCQANATPQPTPKPPVTPVYEPVQVQRTLSIPSDVQGLNNAMQGWIAQANPNSVWQYYQLINVLWPQNNGADPGPKTTVPLDISTSNFTSSGPQPVSNVALETYVQTKTCTTCHQFATIAPSQAVTCTPSLASDFSFVFDDADTPDHYRKQHC